MSKYPWYDHRHCRACDDEARYPSHFCELHRDMRRLQNLLWQAPLFIIVVTFIVLAIKGNW